MTLVEQVLEGDKRALARLLTHVENETGEAETALAQLYPRTGRAHIIGVTGAPGTGKSTLVTELAKAYRRLGQTVGILAVDPSSPFTGGAILGDRIRMRDLSGDTGVFIRSMAARGHAGGLARTTRDAARVLDAAGFDRVLIETVGAGQNEVEIVRMAQTTLVVEAPGLGDDVQAIKAGILEIADVLVVNKADRPGAARTAAALRAMLELGHPTRTAGRANHHGRAVQVTTPAQTEQPAPLWIPPIVQTIAVEGKGIDALIDAIDRHRTHLQTDGKLTALEHEQAAAELAERLSARLLADLLGTLPEGAFEEAIRRVQAREQDPAGAVNALLRAGRQGEEEAAQTTHTK